MKLKILEEAEQEATEAACRYEQQSEGLGERFQTRLSDCIQTIIEHPSRCQIMENVEAPEEVRWARLKQFPYVLVFSFDDEVITIVAVAHGSRRPGYWKERLQ